MCFVSLCARVLSSSTEAEAFRQKKERKLGKREKTKITLCVSTVCVCVCVWNDFFDFVVGPEADGVMIKPIEKKNAMGVNGFFIDSNQ